MTGKRWLAAVGLGLVLAGSGCVSCGHQVCKPAYDAGPNCEVPLCDRRHVYTVLVNGITPGGPSGLDGLREKLAGHGYDKVYYGELCHVWWLWEEMKQVHKDDPTARFVLVGFDFGSSSAVGLARDAVKKGIPVDTVVLLDPPGHPDVGTCSVRTVVIRCTAGVLAPNADGIAIPDATHLNLPTRPQTIDILCGLLKETAMRVEHPPYYEGLEATYDGAPPPRPTVPGNGAGGDWSFLYDQPGTHTNPLSPVPMIPYSPPLAPAVPGTMRPIPGPPLRPYPMWSSPTPPTGQPLSQPRTLEPDSPAGEPLPQPRKFDPDR
jgi:hypothetical protein